MTEIEIRATLPAILDEVIGETVRDKERLTEQEKLGIIQGDSLQVLVYVTAIEDEFDIEIEDDRIHTDLFGSVDVVVKSITTLLFNKQITC